MREPKAILVLTALGRSLTIWSRNITYYNFEERYVMAITRDKKQSLVSELNDLLNSMKMTVYAHYDGLSVADLQTLRRSARENGVTIKVVKNRLVRVAATQNDALKETDTSDLTGQLLYAISIEDEVAPAQVLAKFAKANPNLKIAGAISDKGEKLDVDAVKSLATLPSKDELIAQVIATLSAPLNDSLSALSGDLHGLLDGVGAQAS